MPLTPDNAKQVHLNGDWEFQLDPDGTQTLESIAPDRTIVVPMPWQAAFHRASTI